MLSRCDGMVPAAIQKPSGEVYIVNSDINTEITVKIKKYLSGNCASCTSEKKSWKCMGKKCFKFHIITKSYLMTSLPSWLGIYVYKEIYATLTYGTYIPGMYMNFFNTLHLKTVNNGICRYCLSVYSNLRSQHTLKRDGCLPFVQ